MGWYGGAFDMSAAVLTAATFDCASAKAASQGVLMLCLTIRFDQSGFD
jgi:hypothetical protein